MIGLSIYGSKFIPTALQPNNDLEVWFDKKDPALQAYYEFQETFGNDRIISVAYRDEKGLLNSGSLQKIRRLQGMLENVEGVDHVLSIANAKDFRKITEGNMISMEFSQIFGDNLDSISQESAEKVLSSSLYSDRLLNKQGDLTLMIIHFEPFEVVHKRMDKIIPEIKGLCFDVLGKMNVHFSGADIITFGLNELSREDFIKFTGLSYLIMFIMISLFYRKAIFVILSFLISITTIWLTLSLYGFLGFGLNIFTVMTPPLVIVLCIMMSMHIFNEFENSNTDSFNNKREKAVHCLSEMLQPCLFAALTTMVGFLSLLSSSTAVLKEFGWLTAVGCFLAFILTFVWSAVVLPYVSIKNREKKISHQLGTAMRDFSAFILKKSSIFLVVSFVIFAIVIGGIFNIKIDMNPMGYLPSDNPVVRDHNFMESYWGDYYPIDIVLEAEDSLRMDDRRIINSILDFDNQLVDNELARNTFSYVHVMDRFAQVRYGMSLKEIISQPILMRSFSNSFKRVLRNESNSLVSKDERQARITITGSLQSVRVLETSIELLQKISEDVFGNYAHVKVSGYPALFVRIMNTTFDSMKWSLIIATLLILIIMLILLRNVKIAMIALIVNVFPVLVMLGFLGFSGIDLDIATCTIGAVILGIAIDDTIHILYRYSREKREGVSIESALESTHFKVGRVVVLTSLVLCLGFSIMLLASLKTVFYFGLLSLVSVVAVLYGDLILMTILIKKWN